MTVEASCLLTAPEVAALLRVPEKTLAQWRYRRQGPPFLKLGGHVRYDRSDVDAYLQGAKVGARGHPTGRSRADVRES